MFPTFFPEIKKLEKQDIETPYDDIISWFFNANADFELLDEYTEKQYENELDKITPLSSLLNEYQPKMNIDDMYFMKEFVLWALVEFKKLSKFRSIDGTHFKDPYGSFMSGF